MKLTTQLEGCISEQEEPHLHLPISVYVLAAAGRSLTLHCVTNSVLELGPLPEKLRGLTQSHEQLIDSFIFQYI